VTGDPKEMSHYARLVQRARTERLAIDGRTIDWVLVRNRISMLSSRSMRLVQSAIEKIATRLGARVAEGIAERVIFRSLFPMGLTVFDPLDDELLGGLPSMSHLSARQEYRQLLEALRLPVSERAVARNAAIAALAESEKAPAAFEHMAGTS
jgi:chromosome partitioning protein